MMTVDESVRAAVRPVCGHQVAWVVDAATGRVMRAACRVCGTHDQHVGATEADRTQGVGRPLEARAATWQHPSPN
jgi:hypothetical protein